MCTLICSIVCGWLGVRSGHLLLGSAPLGLAVPSSLDTHGEDEGRAQLWCWRGQGRAPLRTSCPLSLLGHASGLPQGPGLSHSGGCLEKFLLGSQCSFISGWFILCCLESLLVMFVVCDCRSHP